MTDTKINSLAASSYATAARPARRVRIGPVVATGLLAFACSIVWYSPLLFGGIWLKYRTAAPSTPQWTLLFACLREIIAGYVLAQLLVRLELHAWKQAAWLGLGLWLAFFAVSLSGAVIWDNMAWQLGAVHAGDWLMKMLLMSVVLYNWLGRQAPRSAE